MIDATSKVTACAASEATSVRPPTMQAVRWCMAPAILARTVASFRTGPDNQEDQPADHQRRDPEEDPERREHRLGLHHIPHFDTAAARPSAQKAHDRRRQEVARGIHRIVFLAFEDYSP